MRVWELARDLRKGSRELLRDLRELGFDVTAPSSGLSDEAAERLRTAYAALGDTGGEDTDVGGAASEVEEDGEDDEEAAEPAAAEAPRRRRQVKRRRWRLVGKASVSGSGVLVWRGGEISEADYRRLHERQQRYFEAV